MDDTFQPYGVYVPLGWDASATGEDRHPAVIYLHGFGGRLSTSISGAQKTFADANKWLIAYADGRGSVNYDHIGELDVLKVRQELIDNFGAHPDKIYLTGFSMGGHGVYRLGCRFPDLFAACRPGAGWTDYNEFYPHWYEQGSAPKLSAYLDPTRASLLGHTAAVPQVENGLMTSWRVYYGTGDSVNPPTNATQMTDAWQALGHTSLVKVSHGGGHSDEAQDVTYAFFNGKSVNRNRTEVVYRTWRLRHDGAYWIRIDDFREREQQARLKATANPSTDVIDVEATNVEAFTLTPPAAAIPGAGEVVVNVNGVEAWRGAWDGDLTLRTTRDGDGFPDGWTDAAPLGGGYHKIKGQEGPLTDTTRGPFVVVYGASGLDADRIEENRKAALLFCGQWNSMCVLRWGGGPQVAADWYETPYTFSTGAHMSVNNSRIVQPVSDVDVIGLGMDLSGKNKILFGDPDSNQLIGTSYGPLTLHTDAEGGGSRLAAAPMPCPRTAGVSAIPTPMGRSRWSARGSTAACPT
ncbi:MAG: prolyl oligopeptidase family serine peptidase [Planctomycetota bacterium]|nr:prolyl oligopeptidase family serine peptidase [Planctomycetota bacterium]